MQNDRNMTNCTLLLHQQTNLQHDLEKYILVEENIIRSMKNMQHSDSSIQDIIENITNNIISIIAALNDAQIDNDAVIKYFKEYLYLTSPNTKD